MLETNSGVRGSGGSFGGKAQASSSNTTEGNSRSHVVVMAGRWIMYDNGVFLLLMVCWEET
ncbi:BnaC03g76120D [Brassica napus]|uniref:BnaC03g76120D protein n=1 Tax=Brassica napus TaxID=3708 RepID=A0A078GLT0_BRANA|nr:BnaC06g10540D [Brassica napus]CDY49972.1 BnaC03g76120D [Brassica napus]